MSGKSDDAHDERRLIGSLMPLIDVAFLIIIFFMCLPFKALDAKLAAQLPRNSGIEDRPSPPPQEFPIRVHIAGRSEVAREWGPPEARSIVMAPTAFVYRFENGRETRSIEEVSAHIRRLQRSASQLVGVRIRGVIQAGPKVPHKQVIAVLNRFAEAEIAEVDFFGAGLPGRTELLAPVLRYPDGTG